MESGASTVRVHGAPGGTRGRPRPPGPGGHVPKNRSGKKSPQISVAPRQRKVSPIDDFRACRGRYKFLSEALKRFLARVKSPAACRGGGGPQCETPKDI